MKRRWIIASIIFVLLIIVLVIIFYPKKEEENSLNCPNFVYETAWETVYGSSCFNIYEKSSNGNYLICDYFDDEFNKAKCLGISAQKWEDKERCSSLSENNKEICILNVLWKLDSINAPENLRGIDICEEISNQTIRPICLGYKSIINSDYSICKEGDKFYSTCGTYFLAYNKDPLMVKNICEGLFTEPLDLFSCYNYAMYYSSDTINLTRMPEYKIETVPMDVPGVGNIPVNYTIFFDVFNIDTGFDYPYVLGYTISYWKEDPDPYGAQFGPILDVISSETYICKIKIDNLSKINNSCLHVNEEYQVLPYVSNWWNYGIHG